MRSYSVSQAFRQFVSAPAPVSAKVNRTNIHEMLSTPLLEGTTAPADSTPPTKADEDNDQAQRLQRAGGFTHLMLAAGYISPMSGV